ncbi:hypothetical protein BT69DRAFT_475164 [Atractiella rhizophila]|nr:hypothetical protein BT69DRAFT_475164 [Atractiella rhizophila]
MQLGSCHICLLHGQREKMFGQPDSSCLPSRANRGISSVTHHHTRGNFRYVASCLQSYALLIVVHLGMHWGFQSSTSESLSSLSCPSPIFQLAVRLCDALPKRSLNPGLCPYRVLHLPLSLLLSDGNCTFYIDSEDVSIHKPACHQPKPMSRKQSALWDRCAGWS